MRPNIHTELIGTNQAASRRYSSLSIGLVISWLAYVAVLILIGGGVRSIEMPALSKDITDAIGVILFFIPIAISFGAAAVYAHRFKGLAISLALGMSAPIAAMILLIWADFANAGQADTPTSALLLGVLGVGISIAVSGYALGRGTRLLKDAINR